LEERGIAYIVVARLTQEIKRQLHGLRCWQEIEGGAYAVACFQTRLAGWEADRRFVVVRERVREEKAAVGRKLLDVPGYTFRVWVTKRRSPGPAATASPPRCGLPSLSGVQSSDAVGGKPSCASPKPGGSPQA
jgi:hypothetical protein